MNQRFFLALVLTAIVIVVTPLLFPTARRPDTKPLVADSIIQHDRNSGGQHNRTDSGTLRSVGKTVMVAQAETPADTTTVHVVGAGYVLTSQGATITKVRLDSFASRRPSAGKEPVQLVAPTEGLAHYRISFGHDTVGLDTIAFHLTPRQAGSAAPVVYDANVAGHGITLAYSFADSPEDSYLLHTNIAVSGASAGSTLFIDLPRTIRSNEPDTLDDMNHLAVSFRPARGDVKSISFSKLDSTEVLSEPGPLNWVAIRNKYFLVAYRASRTPFSLLQMQGAPRSGKVASHSYITASLPLGTDGSAIFETYAGPQNFERLQQLGGDLDQVNPYAGWFHGVVQPFATIVMKALLWMKRTTRLNYGWVLVLFGVFIRLALWPLNQGAMRTSMKMQRLQPELQALQKKYSDDPQKQQEAIMKVYKAHGMSPLSPLMGCLPMLLPMPVLFALYFVFQNTIEFRGVPFLWLPDISLRDPFFITPILMGISMFIMSWIGMRNSPPNAQAKMMSYMMPVMLTIFFLNLASGLNLYYAVQNIAALPQQWLLARERGNAAAAVTASAGMTTDRRRT